ncbi:UNVERIFIED_CONTAM: hypothetical protein K2H54_014505 [Gekko kuhli]
MAAVATEVMNVMITSGHLTDMAAIPVPLFVLPYAAPKALETMAAEAPMTVKKEVSSRGEAMAELCEAARRGESCEQCVMKNGKRPILIAKYGL